MGSGHAAASRVIGGAALLFAVLGEFHVDGALPAGIARIRFLVEAHPLPFSQLFEAASGDRRMMKEELA